MVFSKQHRCMDESDPSFAGDYQYLTREQATSPACTQDYSMPPNSRGQAAGIRRKWIPQPTKEIREKEALMFTSKIRKLFWLSTTLFTITGNIFADNIDNPCGGPSALLNLVDRPSAGDNACAVPFKQAIIESGIQYQQLSQDSGTQWNYPQSELRVGLPAGNEFVMVLPNYIHQLQAPHSGFSAMTAGVKHQFGYTENWVTAIESIFTLPGGSQAFGSDGTGVALNGIVNYTLNDNISLSFMFGVTSQTEPSLDGGGRFTSFNPDLVLTYVINPKTYVYAETYGQSKTAPDEGSGWNLDSGILYLLKPNFAIDMEVGQRISGQLGGFNHYIGAGFSVMF